MELLSVCSDGSIEVELGGDGDRGEGRGESPYGRGDCCAADRRNRSDEPAYYKLSLWLASLRLDGRDEKRGVQRREMVGGRRRSKGLCFWAHRPRLGRLSVGRPLRP